jgi:hypothetical protein
MFIKYHARRNVAREKIAPTGFSLNQILKEIESIFKFKDLVPMPIDTVGATARVNTPPRVLESCQTLGYKNLSLNKL